MGVLTELKQQAQSILHQEDAHSESQKSLNELHRSNVIDSLRSVYDYMHELLDQLHLVKPIIPVNFQFNDELFLEDFEQTNYEIHVRSSYDDDVVGFVFKLERQGNIDISLDSSKDTQEIIRCIKNAGCLIAEQTTYNIELQGVIPTRIYFKSNFSENRVYIIIDNYQTIGSEQYTIKTESITPELLNEFGNLVLRRESSFIEMLDNARSDSSQVVKLNDTADDLDHTTLTQNMSESRIKSLFTRGQHLYLTYHERITEASSKGNDLMLGRSKGSNIVVDTDCVSRHHAKLVYRKGKFVVIDQSTNGTFIKTQGGQEVFIQNEEYPLSGSGFISLGKTVSVDNEHLIYFSCQ